MKRVIVVKGPKEQPVVGFLRKVDPDGRVIIQVGPQRSFLRAFEKRPNYWLDVSSGWRAVLDPWEQSEGA